MLRDAEMAELNQEERVCVLMQAAQAVHARHYYASETPPTPGTQGAALLERFPSAILAWKAAQLLPNNDKANGPRPLHRRLLDRIHRPRSGGYFLKALVRRCRKTAIGAEADRLRWFPLLDEQGNLKKNGEQREAGKV